MNSPVDRILYLQRTIGNQAVGKLIKSGALQAKLSICQPGDVYEQEADRVAEHVMRMPDVSEAKDTRIQRKCPKCLKGLGRLLEKDKKDEKLQAKEIRSETPEVTSNMETNINAVWGGGQPLSESTCAFFEPRFGHDFSQVRVHSGGAAEQSARDVNANAYTVGHNIVFGAGQFAPGTHGGRRLIAHELMHVVQGEVNEVNRIFRFSDTDHNIIEEVALTLVNLSPEEIKQIHAGNTKRDYSQSPAQLNLVLLCDPSNYGGYKAVEHFDNFRWDEELQKWQSRENPTAFGKKSPIVHIDEELVNFVDALPDKTAFQHVGSAFHAIEDFFAHSNFIELTHGDFTHGRELVTGSVGGSDDVSLLKILESISNQETATYYGERATKEIADAPEKSHARMAKDYKSNHYYLEAVVLAGLVIKEIGTDILAIKSLPAKEQRINYMRDQIMTKVKRYLRPPDENDKWWETLRASGGKEIEKAIRETAARTPVTKNQCILSLMRSIEASRDSNFKLLGPAFPIETKNGHVWIQVGTGFSTTTAFVGPTGTVEPRSMEFLPVGVQITGRF
ncbi:MAG: DUF4157 domain-containing protein [Candidatus Methanoperedens sp.]|nr:DUF4157 domain-containing protein [Candidatus Methanoperedens sp.]